MPSVMKGGSSSGGGRGRRGRAYGVSSSLSEINVVPLVDVMLVLLIIFMVAAPMMQQGISVNLPQSRRSPALPANNEPIYVTVPLAFARNRVVQIGNESVRIDVLRERVRQLIAAAIVEGSVPARGWRRHGAAGHGSDGSPEGRRRREGRHGDAARVVRGALGVADADVRSYAHA